MIFLLAPLLIALPFLYCGLVLWAGRAPDWRVVLVLLAPMALGLKLAAWVTGWGLRRVTLRDERGGRDSRQLWVTREKNGDVVVHGHDRGPRAAELWGRSDYEWTVTIQAAHVPAYAVCLGGKPGSNVLRLLQGSFHRNPACVEPGFLKGHGVPVELWSRGAA